MKRIAMTAVCVLTLAACGNTGSKYVGSWVSVRNAKETMVITENGGHMMVVDSSPSPVSGRLEAEKFVGDVKDGTLEVQTGIPETYVIDKATGHLIGNGAEYKRSGS